MDTITRNGKTYIPLQDYLDICNSLLDAKNECIKLRSYGIPTKKYQGNQLQECKVFFLKR